MKVIKEDSIKRTYVMFVLDNSGSMSVNRLATLSGFNEQLLAVKNMESPTHQVFVSVILFSDPGSGIMMIRDRVPSVNMPLMRESEYLADGASTALWDAMWAGISNMEKNTIINPKNDAVLMITITDGQNNNSREVLSADMIKQKVRMLTDGGNWTFTFMGIDSVENISQGFGIAAANTAIFSKTDPSANTLLNTKGLVGYALSRASGATQNSSFYAGADQTPDRNNRQ